MVKKSSLLAAGLAAVALLGAGCGGEKSSGVSTSEKRAADKKYDKSVDLELPDESNRLVKGGDVDAIVKKVFGDVKVTSFLNDFPFKGSSSVTYTASRPTTQADFNAIAGLIKSRGYSIDGQIINEGTAMLQVSNKKDFVIFTIELGQQNIGVSIAPKSAVDAANAENPDESTEE